MATVVVKLGSSIVADAQGEVRVDVVSGVCEEAARRHVAGDEVVLVTSGAIARGMRMMELPVRPSAMDELQAASAVSALFTPSRKTMLCSLVLAEPQNGRMRGTIPG